VESSCECGYEPSGSIKCWEAIEVSKQLGMSRVVLSSIELVNVMQRKICFVAMQCNIYNSYRCIYGVAYALH
jgi:hypothetical protein